MRIAHVGVEVVPSANGAFVGGLVKNLATVGQAQRMNGHEVHVFTTDLNRRLQDGEDARHGVIHRIPTRGTYGGSSFAATFVAGAVRELRRAHAESPFDVIHIHSAYAAFGAMEYLLRGLGVPAVFSLYSPNFRALPGHDCDGRTHAGRRVLARRCLAPFDATVAPSGSLAARIRSLGIAPERVARISPALDLSMLDGMPSREAARGRLGVDSDRPLVLFLGNYSPWKGVEVLLDAMAVVRRRFPDALLLTAWGEPYSWPGNRREAIHSRIRTLGLEDVVHQVGIVPDVRDLLRAADVLASPFLCTCKVLDYPLSILEAMACGTPVVSTKTGGIPEMLAEGRRGLQVAPGSAEELAAAVVGVIRDDGVSRALATEASAWARATCTPARVAAELDALYGCLPALRFRGRLSPVWSAN